MPSRGSLVRRSAAALRFCAGRLGSGSYRPLSHRAGRWWLRVTRARAMGLRPSRSSRRPSQGVAAAFGDDASARGCSTRVYYVRSNDVFLLTVAFRPSPPLSPCHLLQRFASVLGAASPVSTALTCHARTRCRFGATHLRAATVGFGRQSARVVPTDSAVGRDVAPTDSARSVSQRQLVVT